MIWEWTRTLLEDRPRSLAKMSPLHAQDSNTFRLTYDLYGRSKTAEFSQPRVVVGRNPDCDLVIFARDVSRVHAAIERNPDGWQIVDLGSRYGTFVNHERITSPRLPH